MLNTLKLDTNETKEISPLIKDINEGLLKKTTITSRIRWLVENIMKKWHLEKSKEMWFKVDNREKIVEMIWEEIIRYLKTASSEKLKKEILSSINKERRLNVLSNARSEGILDQVDELLEAVEIENIEDLINDKTNINDKEKIIKLYIDEILKNYQLATQLLQNIRHPIEKEYWWSDFYVAFDQYFAERGKQYYLADEELIYLPTKDNNTLYVIGKSFKYSNPVDLINSLSTNKDIKIENIVIKQENRSEWITAYPLLFTATLTK